MADMMSIIAANYKAVGLTVPTKTPYVAVDPALYEGSWAGKYPDQKTFKITTETTSGFPKVTSIALVQVNETGGYAVNSWVVQAI